MKNSVNSKYEQLLVINYEDVTSGNDYVYIFKLLYDENSKIYFEIYHSDELVNYIMKHAYK